MAGLSSVTVLVLYYALCSSTMLVGLRPYAQTCGLGMQAATYEFCTATASALVARLGASFGAWDCDALEWSKVKQFLIVAIGFLGTIFCNIKVLQYSNVETFITFRSSTPLIISLCDYFFLGRTLPNRRSWVCLLVLVAGAVGYVMVDTAFAVRAYCWLGAWYVAFVFEAVYVKHMCESLKMSNWGRVYYTNLLSVPFMLALLPSLGEQTQLAAITWGPQVLFPLVLSCLVGVCMSHSGYLLRDAVSATMFTLVGIICKIASVMINFLMWQKHATPEGIAFLMLCVLAGTFYQQAPKRQDVKPIIVA
ncbi:hypothetical protein QJQ45_016767 [Haematococcus lacustris]|nr:hypothetical protein QJQ45_016767 [Haematococcus lacustris]